MHISFLSKEIPNQGNIYQKKILSQKMSKIRVYLKVVSQWSHSKPSEESKSLGTENEERVNLPDYYTLMLDRERHKDSVTSFLAQTLIRINSDNKFTSVQENNNCYLTLWLAPNSIIVDLSTVQPDDMLVLGTKTQLEAASTFKCAL